jgi:hypothetical protein
MDNRYKILKISKSPESQLIKLLEDNMIGTPGKSMLYKHVKVSEKVTGLNDPYFCNLKIRDRLYGTVCICKRSVFNQGRSETAFYVRYFTFLDKFRSADQNTRRGNQSWIRDEVAMLMNGEGLEYTDQLLLYAYLDSENIRSGRLIEEFGFAKAGLFHTMPFSRFFPRVSPLMEKLGKEEQPAMYDLLLDFYRDFQLVSFENMFVKGDYFVIKKADEIVCGVQGIPDQWKIIDLPGVSGNLMMHVIPKLPWLKRLFNPEYKFIFLEGIYCKPGYEKQLESLFTSVLAYFNAFSGIVCLDPRSTLYQSVRQMYMGLTHKIMGEKQIEIAVKSTYDKTPDQQAPFFISGFDVL